MGNLKGALFFILCCVMALVVWGLNVIYIDNALPQILTQLVEAFPSGLAFFKISGNYDPVGWVQLFCTLARYSPLYIVVFGGVGWIVEAYIFGRYDRTATVGGRFG